LDARSGRSISPILEEITNELGGTIYNRDHSMRAVETTSSASLGADKELNSILVGHAQWETF